MMNIVLVEVLAVAAASRGYSVRTSEAPDVTKRGESVSMHVRIADEGEEIFTPIVPRGMADLIISFEPGEAARALPLLASDGAIITATTPVVPVTAAPASVRWITRNPCRLTHSSGSARRSPEASCWMQLHRLNEQPLRHRQ